MRDGIAISLTLGKNMRIALLLMIVVGLGGCKPQASSATSSATATQSELLKAARSGGDFEFVSGANTFRFHAVDAALLPVDPEAAPLELHIDTDVTRVMADGTRNSISIESALAEIETYATLTRSMQLEQVAVLKLGISADSTQVDAVIEKLGEEGFGTIALDLSDSSGAEGDSGTRSK